MELIAKLLPGEGTLTYQGVEVEAGPHEIVVRMKSEQRAACCPVCGQASQRQHSRYERTVQDLPWAAFRVIIRLEVGKWFCQNPNCRRRIFTERLPEVVRPWGRRTDRLAAVQTAIGLTTGGRAGAGLSRALQVLTSRVTLLRLVRRQPLKEVSRQVMLHWTAFRPGAG